MRVATIDGGCSSLPLALWSDGGKLELVAGGAGAPEFEPVEVLRGELGALGEMGEPAEILLGEALPAAAPITSTGTPATVAEPYTVS